MKLPPLFLALICTFQLYASEIRVDTSSYCNYYGAISQAALTLQPATAEAKRAIQRIVDVVGLKPNFEIHAANVGNSAAVVIQGWGRRRHLR